MDTMPVVRPDSVSILIHRWCCLGGNFLDDGCLALPAQPLQKQISGGSHRCDLLEQSLLRRRLQKALVLVAAKVKQDRWVLLV